MKFQLLLMVAALTGAAHAQNCHGPTARPDGHAPISIMSDHTHSVGEWMVSLRTMFMDMDDLYRGDSSVPTATAFSGNTVNYAVSPTRMTMQMQMLGVMHAPTDRLTLTAMLPHLSMDMDNRISPGAAPLLMANGGRPNFSAQTSGIGDLKIGSLVRLIDESGHHAHAGLGFSLPTGSIGERDVIPGPPMMGGLTSRQLPAAMQLGSGTFDLLPSLTYRYLGDDWSAGAQANAVVRTGRNAHGYVLGDRFELVSWLARQVHPAASLSTGLSYRWEDELKGGQSDVMTMVPMTPLRTASAAWGENYGGQRVEAMAGINVVLPEGPLMNHRFAADLRMPVWQERNGLGLGTSLSMSLGWQYAF